MSIAVEQYAEYVVDAEILWSVVGSPQRLPEWTDLGAPVHAPSGPDEVDPAPVQEWQPGLQAVVRDGDVSRSVLVVTAQRGVIEVTTDTECGSAGVGVRVVADVHRPTTSRLVFVGRLDEPRGAVRARALDVPRLRRRFDSWAAGLRTTVEG